jgi:hypothetical protein
MLTDPISELKKTVLWQYLAKLDTQYAENVVLFVNSVSKLLESIKIYFPFYTRHDANHSYNVVRRMNEILYPSCTEEGNMIALGRVEIFLLLCSAYGHDLGMTILPHEESLPAQLGISIEPGWETNYILQKHLRETHSERGGIYIYKNHASLGVPLNLVSQLSLLMKAHNLSIVDLQDELGKRISTDFQEIDLMQLASILCIADLLEFSDTRVIDGVIDQLTEAIKESTDSSLLISLRENLKHASISSNLAIGLDGKIIMSGTFTDADVLNNAYKTVDLMQRWIQEYCDIDFRAKYRRIRLRNDSISISFDLPGKQFEKLGIRMNKQSVINLISSTSLWNNQPEVVIRELLQNSVEACRYRTIHSSINDMYQPEITLEIDGKNKKICLTDNGCGMSRSVILNNFLTVGNSRSKDPGYQSEKFSSIARFGVGFWSVFIIAEKAHVETFDFRSIPGRKNLGVAFEVSINELKDYIIFEDKEIKTGTKITLFLKQTVNIPELLSKLSGQYSIIQCSEILIKVKFGGMNLTIPKIPVLVSDEILFGSKFQFASEQNIKTFRKSIKIDSYHLEIFIIYRQNSDSISFIDSDDQTVNHSTMSMHFYDTVCICGFSVRTNLSFPINQVIDTSVIGYIANITNPKGFDFNLTRNYLQPSYAADHYHNQITNTIIETYRTFLIDNNSYNSFDVYRLFSEAGKAVSRGGGFDNSNVLLKLMDKAPDLLVFKLSKIESGKKYEEADKHYLPIKKLLEDEYRLLTISFPVSIHKKYNLTNLPSNMTYEICKGLDLGTENIFLVERGEVDILFNNDPESYIFFHTMFFPQLGNIHVNFHITHSTKIDQNSDKTWISGTVRSTSWTGYVCFKKIIGNIFTFGKQICYLQPGTKLAEDIQVLFAQENHPAICDILRMLELSMQGHIDQKIEHYFNN